MTHSGIDASPDHETIYTPAPPYMLYTVVSLAMVVAFVWMALNQVDPGTILFLIAAVFASLWSLWNIASRVTSDTAGVTLHRPMRSPRRVLFRQLSGVSEEGRVLRVIVALYYPLREDGWVDLDNLRSLTLPALEGQGELFDLMKLKMPH